MAYDSKKYAKIIKSDLTLNEDNTVLSPAFDVSHINGKLLIQVYYNDDDEGTDGRLDDGNTLALVLAKEDNSLLGITMKNHAPSSANKDFNKGDLMAEYIVPPSVVTDSDGKLKVAAVLSDTAGTINGNDIQIQVSAIV